MILLTFTLYLLFGASDNPGHITVRLLADRQTCDREANYWTNVLDPFIRTTVRYKCKED